MVIMLLWALRVLNDAAVGSERFETVSNLFQGRLALVDLAGDLALTEHEPDNEQRHENEQRCDSPGPTPRAFAQLREVVAQFKHPGLQRFPRLERVEEMRVGLEHSSIRRLELALFLRLRFMWIDREIFVHEKVPDLDSFFSGVERFVLSVTDAAEIRIRRRGLRAVTLTDELYHPFALVNLVPQHLSQVTCFRPENVLPDRFVTEEGQRVRNELAGAA